MDQPTNKEVLETVYFGKGENADLLERVKRVWEHVHVRGNFSLAKMNT